MSYMKLKGAMGERFDANMKNWLLTAPYENPGMLQMYFRRNQPHQQLVPWYGEFSGKYLTCVALCYSMEPNQDLKRTGDYVVEQLSSAQDKDGYLGVWPDQEKLKGKNQAGDKTWDAWAHYHNMLGLYFWNKATGNIQALDIIEKAIGCLYEFFVVQNHKIDEDKDGTDAAIGHICALLYREIKDKRCLELVQKTFAAFEEEDGGDYYRAGLERIPFYQMKRTRWECLHAIETIKESYLLTGKDEYKKSFVNIWDGILRNDIHNTGGFTSGERACGNPYDLRAIETCCTIAWMQLCIDALEITDDPFVADQLELSTWNALLGAQQPSGRSFTYNTPMEGQRLASAHDIVFQAVAGSSELNCCSVNGSRGFGMIGQWGLKAKEEQITLNYYGSYEAEVETDKKDIVTITQTGSYPFGSDLQIRISASEDYQGTLRLRIPFWSENTLIKYNGKQIESVQAGTYHLLEGVKNGALIDIEFDMSPHFWQGDRELTGRTSAYIGPILLAYDQRFNNGAEKNADLRVSEFAPRKTECSDALYPEPYLLVEAKAINGEAIILCDFATAGQTGTSYTTWLSAEEELPVLQNTERKEIWGQRF